MPSGRRDAETPVANTMANYIHQYYVYLLSNKKDGVLYLGKTKDIADRTLKHKTEKYKNAFSKRYQTKRLVYFEKFQWVQDANARELKLKKWKQQWKVDLIEKDNPEWLDLAEAWWDEENYLE
jgi:putative endonuclease